MTPAELVHAIRTAPCDDAALEVAEDYARHLISVADASQAAAVAIARQSVAAEYDTLIDGVALEFWRRVTIAKAVELMSASAQARAVYGPNTVEEATLADESFLLFYAAEKG